MRQVSYCKSWFLFKKRATEAWNDTQARSAHDAGTPYTALIGDADRPDVVVTVSGQMGFVGVEFLDDLLRWRLSYGFSLTEPGRLFLSQATYRTFDGDSDRVLSGTTYAFEPSGETSIRRERFKPHQLETAETATDVTGNHEPFPGFGAYEGLCLVERGEIGANVDHC